MQSQQQVGIRGVLRVPASGTDITTVDTCATPGFEGDKHDGERALVGLAAEVSGLQERLFAQSRAGGPARAVLLIVQGMDTSGKGGIMRHVVGMVDPQGVSIRAFKAPTEEELEHDFLWRIRRAVPAPGLIGVFDRSHYEDVLIARVENLVPPQEWQGRYELINAFEAEVVASGTAVVKVMLHISREEQGARLAERLQRSDKHWKYNPYDVDSRRRWPDYMTAYSTALTRCSTDVAPWHVVPADRKWYARWAVASLLVEALREIDPQWPVADFDVEAEKARLAAS